MNVDALRHGGLGALANRGVQAVARALDRFAVDAGRPWSDRLRADRRGVRFEATAFFAGAAGDPGPHVAPDTRARLIAQADEVVAGRYRLLGYDALGFGEPPDWCLDPTTGRRAPAIHWSLIDTLDHAAVGDHKVVWELNRHQWLVDLAHAWRLTRDPRYPEVAVRRLDDWLRSNPPGVGINWASSLEVAYRLLSWCWALAGFHDAPGFGADRCERIAAWMRAHALHVERYLSYYFSPNTHLTGEALGLFCAGLVLPGAPEARRWRRVGATILDDEVVRQVREDGTYFEQAACYQRYTVEIYLQYLILAAHNGIDVDPRVVARVHAATDAMAWMTGPDRRLVRTGDDDGGVLLRGAARDTDDPRGVFAAAAAHFGSRTLAWAAGGPQAETFWLLGEAGVQAFASLGATPPPVRPARAFRDGGYAVARTDWTPCAHAVALDAGPLGCPVSGGHGHADLLSVHAHAYGKPLVVDPGTGSYVAEAGWRDRFRGTAAHSTVMVDGMPQAEPDGPFRWKARPGARLVRVGGDADHELFEGVHDAYRRLDDPVRHRRRVLLLRPSGTWFVVDDLSGDAEHAVDACFQFAPRVVTTPLPDGWLELGLGDGDAVRVRAFSTQPVRRRIEERWVSPAYGRRTRAPALVHRWQCALPLRAVTMFVPADAGDVTWSQRAARHVFTVAGVEVAIGDDVRITPKEGY